MMDLSDCRTTIIGRLPLFLRVFYNIMPVQLERLLIVVLYTLYVIYRQIPDVGFYITASPLKLPSSDCLEEMKVMM